MKCPGQDRSNWTGDPLREVPCPECGAAVEIFRDEGAGHCLRCGHRFLALEADFGCAQWCSVAKECLGFAPDRQSQPSSAESALAAQLIQRLERVCKNDPARIAHTLRVFQFAKELVREEGGDPRVVLCAALLLATGPFESVGAESANEGPKNQPGAEEILREVGLDEVTRTRVCQIVRGAHGGEYLDVGGCADFCANGAVPTLNGGKGNSPIFADHGFAAVPAKIGTVPDVELRIVCDADRLAKLAEEHFAGTRGELENMIQTSLRTETGRSKARSLAQVSAPAGSTVIVQDA